MRNSGEDLEKLVQLVEDILLPKGFTVTPRQRIFDDDGNQIAELDLLISGNLSTTQITWLIECRDRPSSGAAPVSWIEQLYGRRDRLKLDKITAVSTTGFSPAAVDFAHEKGIELRAVEQITKEEVETWFLAESISVFRILGELKSSEIQINDANEEQSRELNEILQNFDNKVTLFVHGVTGDKTSILGLWNSVMQQNPFIADNVEPDKPPRQKIIKVNFDPQDRYKFILHSGDVYIENITFIANVSIQETIIPISRITKYVGVTNQQSIAETVEFDVPIEKKIINLSFHKIDNQNGNIIVVAEK